MVISKIFFSGYIVISSGLLKNQEKTVGPQDDPLSNWLVKDGVTWELDSSYKITSGSLTPSCINIKIEDTGTGRAAEIHTSE